MSTDPLDGDSFAIDSDLDGLSDAFEAAIGTDPALADTDSDGIADGWDVFLGGDPLDPTLPAKRLMPIRTGLATSSKSSRAPIRPTRLRRAADAAKCARRSAGCPCPDVD